jgi:hypothetical protein
MGRKKIKKQLDRMINRELRFQNLKDLKNEYDQDWEVSCGIVIGLSRAIKIIDETKTFELSLSKMLLENKIS